MKLQIGGTQKTPPHARSPLRELLRSLLSRQGARTLKASTLQGRGPETSEPTAECKWKADLRNAALTSCPGGPSVGLVSWSRAL